jgi:hypothetical protein
MLIFRILPFLFLSYALTGCKSNVSSSQENGIDTMIQTKTIPPAQSSVSNPERIYSFALDSILVILKIDSPSSNKIDFDVLVGKETFKGLAKLVLLEDNGKFYVPESTARRDNKTGQEYFCDSTYNYVSEKVNFVFAIENITKKRLSFIVNNSLIAGIEDNIYTLYRRD